MRERVRAGIDGEFESLFCEAFDGLGAGDDVVHIRSLEVTLSVASAGDLLERLREGLETALREACHAASVAARKPAARTTDAPAYLRSVLLHYLAHGELAWHAASLATDAMAHALREQARGLAEEATPLAAFAAEPLRARIAAAMRLLQLLDAAARARIVQQALGSARGAPRSALAARLANALSRESLAADRVLRAQALALASSARASSGEDAAAWAAARQAIAAVLRDDSAQPRDPLAALGRPLDAAALAHDAPSAMPETRAGIERTAACEVPPEHAACEGIAALDAGLVLLHAYLPALLAECGLVATGSREIAGTCLPRAAMLLHWLMAGRDEAFEYELATAKLLLGVAPERALLTDTRLLTDADRAEGDALLAAAVSHWTALGSTSIDGLRTAFLQRRGTLRDLGHAWHLQVQPGPFDVLLARAPWALGIVKLPWMTRPISIDWPTR